MASSKSTSVSTAKRPLVDNSPPAQDADRSSDHEELLSPSARASKDVQLTPEEKRLRLKVDLRLCSIAGILASLDLIDSILISSASVTSIFQDLSLTGSRYAVAIWIFAVANIAFQLPCTIATRTFGPRYWLSGITVTFGVITIGTAFIHSWQEMIALRVLLGIATSGIYPGLSYLISTWYTRREQQLRFALLQAGQVVVLATGSILNWGLFQLDGKSGLRGWQWMYLVQGLIATVIGFLAYWWVPHFPEFRHKSFKFLSDREYDLAVERLQKDRGDVVAPPFTWNAIFEHVRDPKVYGWAVMFFLQNLVSTSLSYFLPIILQSGMGFSTGKAIILSGPPYYYAAIPVLLSAFVGDRYGMRGPVIIFNSLCLIAGFVMLGFASEVSVRYAGTFLATGAYVSNWAAMNAYFSTNIVGQWKRVYTAAVVTAFNRAGGVAGSYILKSNEAPRYPTAVWVSIGSHLVIIAVVGVFSAAFVWANRREAASKRLIANTRGFRYSY